MFEVYYKAPADPKKEAALRQRVCELGGRLDYREEGQDNAAVTLTYEFDQLEQAEAAAESLRRQGEHVEGPQDYGA
jgi:hypothetical protein